MKKRVWISPRCTAPRAPVNLAILWWLLLDRLGAPSWAYGVMWTLVVIFAIVFLVDAFTGEGKDVSGFGPRP